eukprot:14558784-Alexandrium_andersonii.AAC.1
MRPQATPSLPGEPRRAMCVEPPPGVAASEPRLHRRSSACADRLQGSTACGNIRDSIGRNSQPATL